MSLITKDPNYRASNSRYIMQLILADANANFMQDYNCVNRPDKNNQPSTYYNKFFVIEGQDKDGSVISVEYDPIYQFGTEKHIYVQQGVTNGKKLTEDKLLGMKAYQAGIQQDLNDEYEAEWKSILGCTKNNQTIAPAATPTVPTATEQLRVGIKSGYTISNSPMSAAQIIAEVDASKGSYKAYYKHM
jgi:hypothetical protein